MHLFDCLMMDADTNDLNWCADPSAQAGAGIRARDPALIREADGSAAGTQSTRAGSRRRGKATSLACPGAGGLVLSAGPALVGCHSPSQKRKPAAVHPRDRPSCEPPSPLSG
jgi:hypothetical protein